MSAKFYRICQDGYVYPADKRAPSATLYFVETCLMTERGTESNPRYTSYLQDKERQRVPGNVLEWQGIRCRIAEHDEWEINDASKQEFGINGVVLEAHIIDKRNREHKVLFDNNAHNGLGTVLNLDKGL